mmetsp:Transcript_44815/g.83621  ORF Transcript_44815/g.83621 Transcript_44815/m.83621 type:complete len:216 (-) Transcript_44815:35-682(-)
MGQEQQERHLHLVQLTGLGHYAHNLHHAPKAFGGHEWQADVALLLRGGPGIRLPSECGGGLVKKYHGIAGSRRLLKCGADHRVRCRWDAGACLVQGPQGAGGIFVVQVDGARARGGHQVHTPAQRLEQIVHSRRLEGTAAAHLVLVGNLLQRQHQHSRPVFQGGVRRDAIGDLTLRRVCRQPNGFRRLLVQILGMAYFPRPAALRAQIRQPRGRK